MPDKKGFLLIQPPSDQKYRVSIQEPLGLLYLAGVAREHNIHVDILDLNVLPKGKKKLKEKLTQHNYNWIGISSNISSVKKCLFYSSFIKKHSPHSLLFVGGPHPTICPEEYLHADIDYIVPFEGEIPLKNLFNNKELTPAHGFFKNTPHLSLEHFQSFPSKLIDHLDELPFPAHDLIDLTPYYINSIKAKPIVSLMTSRGCPSHCIFLTKPFTLRL